MIETIESDFIHDGNAENFPSLVIKNSNLGPVLVNFWSRKAGPCLRQYPILDKLVHDYNGRLLLVNVDTEKETIISKDYGIASVPTLKLFRFGETVSSLFGYQSEVELKKIIDRYVVCDSDKIIEQAINEYSSGHYEKSYQLLTDAIFDDQINPRLPLTICKLLKYEKRFGEALKLLDSLPLEIKDNSEIFQMTNQLYFLSILDSDDDIKTIINNNEIDLPSLKKLSAYYVIEDKYELALQVLEKIIGLDYDYDEGYARTAMLKIFNIIGDDQILAQKYRPLLLKYIH